jgi:hypothetical protein
MAQLVEALRAGFAGDDAGLGIALGEDEGFSAGGGAASRIFCSFWLSELQPASSAINCEPSSCRRTRPS